MATEYIYSTDDWERAMEEDNPEARKFDEDSLQILEELRRAGKIAAPAENINGTLEKVEQGIKRQETAAEEKDNTRTRLAQFDIFEAYLGSRGTPVEDSVQSMVDVYRHRSKITFVPPSEAKFVAMTRLSEILPHQVFRLLAS